MNCHAWSRDNVLLLWRLVNSLKSVTLARLHNNTSHHLANETCMFSSGIKSLKIEFNLLSFNRQASSASTDVRTSLLERLV